VIRSYGEGDESKAWLSFMGITPAPKTVLLTDAEQLASHYLKEAMPSGGRTPEEVDASRKRAAFRDAVRKGDPQAIEKAATNAGLSPREKVKETRKTALGRLEAAMKLLSAEEALNVYDAGNDAERQDIKSAVQRKLARFVAEHNDLSGQAMKDKAAKLGL